ncbi:uncharacterized protein LOC142189485 [Leptodactylus fuscus]|uniref:uncharacterized protein LOC142189485 n=1 Tax=Leptodactylus fuscus TaxID=238119 RepID=UPI003F4EEC0D
MYGVRYINVSPHNQDYTVVKKPSSGRCQTLVFDGWRGTLSPIPGPPPHPLKQINGQKILELTNKMLELLTGEVTLLGMLGHYTVTGGVGVMTVSLCCQVPIRCQDVAVYFSMEEWEYLEGHKDLYKEVMMEDHQPLTSAGRSSKRTTPERCPSPLLPQDDQVQVPQRMERDRNKMAESLLNLTLEIIYQLTGEDYTVVKKTSSGRCQAPVYEGYGVRPSPGPSPHCRSSKRTTPERCPSPLLPQDDQIFHQIKDLDDINVIAVTIKEEPYVSGYEECEEDIRTRSHPGDCTSPEGHPIFSDPKEEGHGIKQDPDEELAITPDIPSALHNQDRSDPILHVQSSASSQTVKRNKSHRRRKRQRAQKRKRPFPCPECGKYFTHKSDVVRHMTSHTGEKPFSCSECEKSFGRRSNLLRHLETHTGEKPFLCTDCGKCFNRNSDLVRHQRTHTGEKPFPCSECGRCFAQSSALVNHQRIHTTEKPFSCSECGKCFTHKATLVNHRKSHTGEKLFQCSECGQSFSRKSHLLSHQRSHTKEKPYSCTECEKAFSQKAHLVSHQRIHTGEKPFSCSECGKCFNQKAHVYVHQRTHTAKSQFQVKEERPQLYIICTPIMSPVTGDIRIINFGTPL